MESQSISACLSNMKRSNDVQCSVDPVPNSCAILEKMDSVDDMEVVPLEDDTVNISDSTTDEIDVVNTDEVRSRILFFGSFGYR